MAGASELASDAVGHVYLNRLTCVDGFKGWGQNPSCLPRLQVILLSGKKAKEIARLGFFSKRYKISHSLF